MATISITVAAGGFNPPAKTFTFPDAELLRLIAAYQQDANDKVGGAATKPQVMNYIVSQWIASCVQRVQTAERDAAVASVVVPAPINPA